MRMQAFPGVFSLYFYTKTGKADAEIDNRIKNIPNLNKQQYAISMIPYIKDINFNEEREYRLIFDMRKLIAGKVCNGLRYWLSPRKIKIWCDGYILIRKIFIAPSKDAEFMKTSVEEYKKTKYWVKAFEVKISKIPLRT